MTTILRSALAIVALTTWSGSAADAATQTVLGRKFQVRNPVAADSTKRKVIGLARERNSSHLIVGNPVADGAVVQVIANGATDSDHTLNLPKEGWSAISTLGYKYSGQIPGGAVRRALIKRTPSGIFMIKIVAQAKRGPIVVVPPNPGEDGGFILKITGGDNYCVGFGSTAGGSEIADDAEKWAVKDPTVAACPVPSGAPPSTSTTTSTTSPVPTTTSSSSSSTSSSSSSSSTVVGATTSTSTTSTLPPFPFNDCGGSPFPTCDGTGCPAGYECAIVFAEPSSSDGGCACVPVGPGEAACNGVPPASCPASPVCPPGSTCFANPFFGGGCGCGQCAEPFCP